MNASRLRWYGNRLRGMSAPEVAWRVADRTRQIAWSRQQVTPGAHVEVVASEDRHFRATLPRDAALLVPPEVRERVVAAADGILAGRWEVLGTWRKDIDDPDWFWDPGTGRTAPQKAYCFSIDYRSQEVTGNVKQIWEVSRMHHLTVVAAAFAFTGNEAYAEAVARQLRSWWAKNTFLSGINWTSGIEVGLRLIAWVWIRRLLEGWPGTRGLFEDNADALRQICWHQRYLAAFRSRGSSANNHVIAEAAGGLVAALAFPWFPESSGRWRQRSAALLERELASNTFASGVNRELASEYHGFVAELALVAAAEADLAAQPLQEGTWQVISRMLDVTAATLDQGMRPPRQGDGDDGRGLVLDAPDTNRWASLLSLGSALVGAPDWWPECAPDAMSVFVASIAGRHNFHDRPDRRPAHFPDAGMTIMRDPGGERPEIWCRCDAGPHGFLSIAAHAHADALAVEVRHGGVDILADPGTYCYHGEKEWRSYFRSTLAHNTIEVAGRSQSQSGGPFLWIGHAVSRVLTVLRDADGEVTTWCGEHAGYSRLTPPVCHRRTVHLLRAERRLEIIDELVGCSDHHIRMAFHLGPNVSSELQGNCVSMKWPADTGEAVATLSLPKELVWSAVRGSTKPVCGWYSAHFGHKEPATSLLGEATTLTGQPLKTVLQLDVSGRQ